ncbi:Hypothetical predicted protein [Octopus vulgaris]|uniref:Uncharacterized protein n=1 Tax=Octopus vulgaris TaxID=6645 RepID=A0AA36AZM5_OCTVU|nr:Hypothetical predicted protein [Octopus vulgaris]
MKSYAEATAEDPEKEKLRKLTLKSLNWDPEKMKRYLSKVEIEATNVKLVMPEEKKKMLRDLTRVYRTFSNESRRIEIAPEFQIETMVSCCMDRVVFINRGSQYGTINITFENVEAEKKNDQVIEGNSWTLIPDKPGKKLGKIRVGRIPPIIEPEWVIVGIFGENLKKRSTKLNVLTNRSDFKRSDVGVFKRIAFCFAVVICDRAKAELVINGVI